MEMTFLRNATCCLPFDVSTQSVTNIYAHFIIIMCFVIIYSYVLILLICWALHLPEVVPIYFKKCHDLWPCLLCDCENFMKLLPWCVVVWLKMTFRGSLGMALLFGGVTLLDQVWSCWRKCLTEGGRGRLWGLGSSSQTQCHYLLLLPVDSDVQLSSFSSIMPACVPPCFLPWWQ